MQIRSLAREDPLEEKMSIDSSNLCPWGCKEWDTTEHARTHTRMHVRTQRWWRAQCTCLSGQQVDSHFTLQHPDL